MKTTFNTTLLFFIFNILLQSNIKAQDYAENDYSDYNTMVLYFDKGKECLYKGKNIEALAYFQTSLIYCPQQYATAPLIMTGNAACHLEYYGTGIDYYFKAIDLSENQIAYSNLAGTYGRLGEDNLALETFELVDAERQSNKYIGIGAIAERNGEYKKALEYMYMAKNANSEYIPFYNLGVIHSDLNDTDSAIYYFEKAIEIDPDGFSGYNGLLSVYLDLNKTKEEYTPLCKKIIKLIEKDDKGYGTFLVRGNVYRLLGQKKKMKTDLEQCISRLDYLIKCHPQSYTFLTDRGRAHAFLGNKEAAAKDYMKSLEINPNYALTKERLKELLDNE